MKKIRYLKGKLILLGLIVAISILIMIPAIAQYYSNFSSSLITNETNMDNLTLLHSYSFEDNIVGEDPSGMSLWVKDDPADGNVEIANFGDEQQKHVFMHKIDRSGGKRVLVRDNVSIYGDTFQEGEIHFRMYKPDTSGFEVGIATPNEKAIHIWFWQGKIIDRTRYWYVPGDDGYIVDHPLNQWFEIVIYFNLNKGWMLDFDGERYGGDYEYGYIVEFTEGVSKITYSSFASAGGSGYAHFDDIAFFYYEKAPNPVIVDGHNGVMNLKMIGDGTIFHGTSPDNLIEAFSVNGIGLLPNYGYDDANIEIYPRFYGKDTVIIEDFEFSDEKKFTLDEENAKYISDIESQISSVEYQVDASTESVQYLVGWERAIRAGNVEDMVWKEGNLHKLHDGDIITPAITVQEGLTVYLQGQACSADGGFLIGTEIQNSAGNLVWDWDWNLKNVDIDFTLQMGVVYPPPLNLYCSVGQYVYYSMVIMARDSEGNDYEINVFDPIIKSTTPALRTSIYAEDLPGFSGSLILDASKGISNYELSLDSTVISNLADINRYSNEVLEWYGEQGNPVINYRIQAYAFDNTWAHVLKIYMGLNNFNCKYSFQSETPISSGKFRVDASTESVQYLVGWERKLRVGSDPYEVWKKGDLCGLHDEDIFTPAITIQEEIQVLLQGQVCSVDGGILIGTEIQNSAGNLVWDLDWNLKTIDIDFTLELGVLEILEDEVLYYSMGQYIQYAMVIMARDSEGNDYAINLFDPIVKASSPPWTTVITADEIHGFTHYRFLDLMVSSRRFGNFKLSLDNSIISNLADINRYSNEVLGWHGEHGNPVINYRIQTYASDNILLHVPRIFMGLTNFNCKYSIQSEELTTVFLSKQDNPDDINLSENYFFSAQGYVATEKGWENRYQLSEDPDISYLTIKTDVYNIFDHVIVNLEYIKIRYYYPGDYYSEDPRTRCDLNINNLITDRFWNHWQFSLTNFNRLPLYHSCGSYASIDLSSLSLSYVAWDTGWEYTDSIVFAYKIVFQNFIVEDIIPYYDGHGEFFYDLGYWDRDITIEWKEVQLEGVYIEDLYINNDLLNPSRVFSHYHNEIIEVWDHFQSITIIWPAGTSYERIIIEFDTQNTWVGSNVEIEDEVTGIEIQFDEVTGSGETIIEKSDEEPDPPLGFEVAGDYYEINTDATYTGTISLAIPYDETKVFGPEENLKLLHWESATGWTDVTTGLDIENNIIYGEVTSFSLFLISELVEHEYIMLEIDQLIKALDLCLDDCWREETDKITMISKLIELKTLVSSEEIGEAYDKLLHDIKPKLTGLKTDENEVPWDHGLFENPWVTCEVFQVEYCSACNKILEHLSVLLTSVIIESNIANGPKQMIFLGSSLIGLVGIVISNLIWHKRHLFKLNF
ncbi:MAG: hypothetical protein ACFFE4_07930 [Candidatus Thorarchaeota archaeon]